MARISYLAVLLVLAAHIMVKQGEASICSEPGVQRIGAECNSFTGGQKPEPSGECCNAYRAVRSQLKTKAERREYCSCAHQVISQYPDSAARIPRIDSLPEKCGVPFLFSGDPKFDCTT
ncbi:non-specific lipid-transfer protein 3-like [Apium graveolens]|uniref:non-specific lipid-transfer protein 3-like n=1 Tax=Apium graveolens TaxID=4045 RepID=UPI003D7B2519